MSKNNITIVTGLSGAGLSSSLSALEDLGYEVLDNFPVALIDPLLQDSNVKKPIALGIDTRTRGFSPAAVLDAAHKTNATLLFLTADESILQKRFTETRRKHPLATDRPVSAGIRKELEILHSLRDHADILIDTSEFSIHDLRRTITGHFSLDHNTIMTLTLRSFGFKYGLPREADMVFDVRFLRNPHWEETLKSKTGQDQEVVNYIREDDDLKDFIKNVRELIGPLLPRYQKEGRKYLTIAIGCTGGKHRSVFLVEEFSKWLKEQGYTATLHHRDIDR